MSLKVISLLILKNLPNTTAASLAKSSCWKAKCAKNFTAAAVLNDLITDTVKKKVKQIKPEKKQKQSKMLFNKIRSFLNINKDETEVKIINNPTLYNKSETSKIETKAAKKPKLVNKQEKSPEKSSSPPRSKAAFESKFSQNPESTLYLTRYEEKKLEFKFGNFFLSASFYLNSKI